MGIALELLWAFLVWLGGKILVPVVIHLLERWIPDMLTKKRKWNAKERAVTRLKRFDTRGKTIAEIAEMGKRRKEI